MSSKVISDFEGHSSLSIFPLIHYSSVLILISFLKHQHNPHTILKTVYALSLLTPFFIINFNVYIHNGVGFPIVVVENVYINSGWVLPYHVAMENAYIHSGVSFPIVAIENAYLYLYIYSGVGSSIVAEENIYIQGRVGCSIVAMENAYIHSRVGCSIIAMENAYIHGGVGFSIERWKIPAYSVLWVLLS